MTKNLDFSILYKKNHRDITTTLYNLLLEKGAKKNERENDENNKKKIEVKKNLNYKSILKYSFRNKTKRKNKLTVHGNTYNEERHIKRIHQGRRNQYHGKKLF